MLTAISGDLRPLLPSCTHHAYAAALRATVLLRNRRALTLPISAAAVEEERSCSVVEGGGRSKERRRETFLYSVAPAPLLFLAAVLVPRVNPTLTALLTLREIPSRRDEAVRSMARVLREGLFLTGFAITGALITKFTDDLTEEDAKNSRFVQEHKRQKHDLSTYSKL